MVIYVASITIYILLINGTFFFFISRQSFVSLKSVVNTYNTKHMTAINLFLKIYTLHYYTIKPSGQKKKKAPTKRRFKHRYLKSQHKHLLSTHIN